MVSHIYNNTIKGYLSGIRSFRTPGTRPAMEGVVQAVHPMGHAARHQAGHRVPSQAKDGHHFTQATEVRTGLARTARIEQAEGACGERYGQPCSQASSQCCAKTT
eukprot:4627778-Pyramimonas_sp.AAC.1